MVLTYNYNDLQNIKTQIIEENIKNNEEIYLYIEAYKETLNFMFKNNLANKLTKEELETDLLDFATSLLNNTDMTYKQLELQYRNKIMPYCYIRPNEIKLKL